MRHLVFAVAADLQFGEGGVVEVGPETRLVLQHAVDVAHRYWRDNVEITVAAGYSAHFKVMMEDVMREKLRELTDYRIITLNAQAFDTNGEMAALARYIIKGKGDLPTIHLVCRQQHLPRARLLLKARLGPKYWRNGLVQREPVKTNWPEGPLYEPLAIVKNLPHIWPALFFK